MKNWNNTTIAEYNAIQEIWKKEWKSDFEKTNAIAKVLLKVDLNYVPLCDLQGYYKELEYLATPIPRCRVQSEYTIGGKKYSVSCDMADYTVSRYMDFKDACVDNDLAAMVCVFLKDREGNQPKRDVVLELSMADAQNIAFFLRKRQIKFTRRFLAYSISTILTGRKIPFKMRIRAAVNMIKSAGGLIYYHTY